MLSQEAIADTLNVGRSTWAGYEKGKSEPTVSVLKKISVFFEVSTDVILFQDIENPIRKEESIALKNDNLRVLAITINQDQRQNIELVPTKAIAGYAQNFSNISFIENLDRFSIPKLEEGTFRAFEIKGTSMQPINEGSIVIGKYIEHIRDLRNNRRYILILKEEGVVFKRVIKEIDVNNRLVLISDNPEFLPFTVHLENILEAWEMIAFVGYGDKIEDSSSFLMQKMNQIEQKMNQVIGTKS